MKLNYTNKLLIQEYINANFTEDISSSQAAFEIYKKLQYTDTQIYNSISVTDRICIIKKQIDFIQKSIVNILYENNNYSAKGLKCGYVYAIKNPAWPEIIKLYNQDE